MIWVQNSEFRNPNFFGLNPDPDPGKKIRVKIRVQEKKIVFGSEYGKAKLGPRPKFCHPWPQLRRIKEAVIVKTALQVCNISKSNVIMTKLSDISKGQNCINREKRYGPQKQRYKEGSLVHTFYYAIILFIFYFFYNY